VCGSPGAVADSRFRKVQAGTGPAGSGSGGKAGSVVAVGRW